MKIVKIKSILFFFVTVLLAFAFPMQVMMSSPIISLAPYAVLASVFLLTRLQSPYSLQLRWNARKPIMFLISVYLVLVFVQTGWQTVFGINSPGQGVSAIVIYALPVLFFVYFHSIATNHEFRAILFAMAIVGLAVGAYFVYDSYSMLVLHQLQGYSLKAFEYSQLRAPEQEINAARISVGYRSHGLLENHAVTAAWIVLGCLAALTLLPKNQSMKRALVILVYGVMLLVGLNFTAIVGFVFVLFLMEYRGYVLLRGNISKRIILFLQLIIGGFVLIGLTLLVLPGPLGEDMYAAIVKSLTAQVDLASGKTALSNSTYFGRLISEFISFPFNMLEFPPGVLIGSGFRSFVISGGGDYGIIETLHRFGLPFFLAIIIGLMRLIRRALKQIERGVPDQSPATSYLLFAASVIIYLLFTEIHYTVWSAKSILPILFVSLAIFDRYLYSPTQLRLQYQGPVV